MKKAKNTTTKINKQIIDSLKKKLDSNSTIWHPDVGDEIFGIVTEIKDVVTKIGKKKVESKLVTLETDKGETSLWLSTVLANQFEKQGIDINSVVGIRYLGDDKGYKNYNVVKL